MDINSKFEYRVVSAQWHDLEIQIQLLSSDGFRIVSIVQHTMTIVNTIDIHRSYDHSNGVPMETPFSRESMPTFEYKIIGEKEVF